MKQSMLACAALLLFTGCSSSTSTAPSNPAPAPNESLILPAEGYNTEESCDTVTLQPNGRVDFTLVGEFPNPSRSTFSERPYIIKCPNFIIRHTNDGRTGIFGLNPSELQENVGNNFLKLENSNIIDMSQTGEINIVGEYGVPSYEVVAVKIGEELLPLLHEGNITPVSYDVSQMFTVYRQQQPWVNWQVLQWFPEEKAVVLFPHGGLD